MKDLYIKITGVAIHSEKEIKVNGDCYNLNGDKVSSCCTLYLPNEEPYPTIGDRMRLSYNTIHVSSDTPRPKTSLEEASEAQRGREK